MVGTKLYVGCMQLHMLSREMVNLGLALLKYIPYNMVDSLMVILSKLVYGDLNKYGITRPEGGPFFLKVKYGKYPVVNTGTFGKIKSGEIQVRERETDRGPKILNHIKATKYFLAIFLILYFLISDRFCRS